MDFLDCVKNRRSIRKFTDEKISHDLISEIVEIASYSPSWKNTQVVRYTFIDNKETLDKIADDCVLGFEFNSKIIKNAPALVIVSMIEKRSGYERDGSFSTPKGDGFEMFDAGISTQTFCLASHEKGLGTVIMGYFDEEKIKPLISLPDNQKIGAVLAIGYPQNNENIMPKRKPVSDLVTFK